MDVTPTEMPGEFEMVTGDCIVLPEIPCNFTVRERLALRLAICNGEVSRDHLAIGLHLWRTGKCWKQALPITEINIAHDDAIEAQLVAKPSMVVRQSLDLSTVTKMVLLYTKDANKPQFIPLGHQDMSILNRAQDNWHFSYHVSIQG